MASAGAASRFAAGLGARSIAAPADPGYQFPVLGIDAHGSFGGRAAPFCSSSIECWSGERTNAMCRRAAAG